MGPQSCSYCTGAGLIYKDLLCFGHKCSAYLQAGREESGHCLPVIKIRDLSRSCCSSHLVRIPVYSVSFPRSHWQARERASAWIVWGWDALPDLGSWKCQQCLPLISVCHWENQCQCPKSLGLKQRLYGFLHQSCLFSLQIPQREPPSAAVFQELKGRKDLISFGVFWHHHDTVIKAVDNLFSMHTLVFFNSMPICTHGFSDLFSRVPQLFDSEVITWTSVSMQKQK